MLRWLVLVPVLLVAGGASAVPEAVFSASRTADCVAPCAVFFDATATRAPGFDRPFHTLFYEWDFGDERGEAWAVSGRPKNRAVGGIAGHLYEQPGGYTVRLQVTDPRGESAIAETRVLVSDPERVFAGKRTTCVSAAGDFAGCPEGARRATEGDFDRALVNGAGHRTLLRRGERFRWDTTLQLEDADGAGASLGAFGPGETRPVVHTTEPVFLDAGNDWRVAGIVFEGTGQADRVSAFRERTGVRRFTVHDVEIRAFNYCADFWSRSVPDEEVALVEVRCRDFPDPSDGAKLFEDTERSMFLGLEIDKGDPSHPKDRSEFVHRAAFSRRKLIQHSRYQGRAPNHSKNVLQLRHCMAVRGWKVKCPEGGAPSQYVIVSDNHFIEEGGPRASSIIRVCDHGSCEGKPGDSQRILDYVFERNLIQVDFDAPAKERLFRVFQLQAERVTVRNNVADLQGWPTGSGRPVLFAVVTPYSDRERNHNGHVEVLHNTIYLGRDFPSSIVLCNNSGAQLVCANNLVYAPGMRRPGAAVRGEGWAAHGNLFAAKDPFAGPLPGPLGATLHDLSGFELGPGAGPAAASFDLRGGVGRPVQDDARGGCRGVGPPDVGAIGRGGAPCPPFGAPRD